MMVSIHQGAPLAVNQEERAYRAWPILTRRANDDEPITYGELAEQLGMHHRPIRYVLDLIQRHCLDEKLPPLTIIVVNQAGVPGSGFIAWDIADFATGQRMVSHYDWDASPNPFAYAADGATVDELAERIQASPERAEEVYALVKVRGVAQIIFRQALLRVYRAQCAICGLSFEQALEGAHLIPWNDATWSQRMSPTNGVLLCSTHHRMLDGGLITITESHVVRYRDPDGKARSYSGADHAASTSLHGRKALMPASPSWQPAKEALAHHHRRLLWDPLP